MAVDAPSRSWDLSTASGSYIISTDPALLSHSYINSAFASEDMYWAQPLPTLTLSTLLSNSLNLGLYKRTSAQSDMPPPRTTSSPSSPRDGSPTVELEDSIGESHEEQLEQIGFARFITDHVSTFYLTDVYVLPTYRGSGLGKWLIGCCQDIMQEAKHMRRALLMASPDEGKSFYERELGMWDLNGEGSGEHVVCMTRRKY